jgi:hypothetical protein
VNGEWSMGLTPILRQTRLLPTIYEAEKEK